MTPTISPILLAPPVALDAITSPTDRFRCERQHAVITAAECKRRHAAAHVTTEAAGKTNSRKVALRIARSAAQACVGCTVGPAYVHPQVP